MDLVEFLRARLSDDERLMLEPPPQGSGHGHFHPADPVGAYSRDCPHCRYAVISANPDVALVDVETKRRIVASIDGLDRFDQYDVLLPASLAWEILCLLALPYADHPDYDPDWRPSS